MNDLLTAREAADLLHLHVKRVQALARTGKLPALRHGRKWLFPRARLDEALQRGRGQGEAGEAGEAADPRAARHRPAGHGDSTPTAGRGVELSARNQLRGTVTRLVADGVMAEVRIRIGGQELVAIITRESAERLGLEVGVDVLAVVKATEVMVARAAERG